MHLLTSSLFSGLVATTLFLFAAPARAFTTAYCSSQNTADGDAKTWTWQSNGWCKDQCGGYAYAVLLTNDCWCSNYAPADQGDTSDCSDACPGYPTELCGNKEKSLYIYVELDGKPSGTKGGGSEPTSAKVSSSSETPPSSTGAPPSSEVLTPSLAPPSPTPSSSPSSVPKPDPETIIQTVTASAPLASSLVETSIPTPTPSPPPTPSSQAPDPTTLITSASSSAPPRTSIQIITESGVAVTKTVIVAAPSSESQQTQGQNGSGDDHGGSSSNTGAIVGGVVGGIAAIAAIVAAVFFVLLRRRKQRQQSDDDAQSGVHRNVSTLSKAGLLRGEKTMPHYPPPIATTFSSNSKRASRTLDTESISPVSGSDRRNSRPYIFDQRLNPSAIMHFDNGSRGSVASLEDSRDYGRTLNVRNPDLDPR